MKLPKNGLKMIASPHGTYGKEFIGAYSHKKHEDLEPSNSRIFSEERAKELLEIEKYYKIGCFEFEINETLKRVEMLCSKLKERLK